MIPKCQQRQRDIHYRPLPGLLLYPTEVVGVLLVVAEHAETHGGVGTQIEESCIQVTAAYLVE